MEYEKKFPQILSENLDILRRRSSLFLTLFIGTFLIASFFALRTAKVYESKTTFYFPMQTGNGPEAGLSNSVLGKSAQGIFAALLPTSQATLQNYAQGILESRWIAGQLIDRFNLMQYYHTRFRSAAVEALHQATQIRLTNEGIMEITVRLANPKLAADVANGYVDAYRDFVANSTTTIAKKHRLDVEQRLSQLKQSLSQAEADMSAFQTLHKSMDFSAESKILAGALLQLQMQRLTGKVLLTASQKMIDQEKRRLSDELTFASSHPLLTSALDDPVIENLRVQLADIYLRYAEAKATETSSNPELKFYQAQLKETEAVLRNQLGRRIQARKKGEGSEFVSARLKADILKTKSQALDQAIAQLEKQLSYYPAVALDYVRKERKLKVLETLYTFLSTERERAKLDEAKESPSVEVLDQAIPSDFPISARRLYSLLLGLLLAFVLAIAGVYVTEYLATVPKLVPLNPDGHPGQTEEFDVLQR